MNYDYEARIKAGLEKWMACANRGDLAGIAALYTEDGQILPPNSDFVTGRAAIQGFLQVLVDMGMKSVKLESIEVEGMGETAYEVG